MVTLTKWQEVTLTTDLPYPNKQTISGYVYIKQSISVFEYNEPNKKIGLSEHVRCV